MLQHELLATTLNNTASKGLQQLKRKCLFEEPRKPGLYLLEEKLLSVNLIAKTNSLSH